MPAWQIRDQVASRKLSAVDVTRHFLSRIDELDPKLHAFRKVDRDGALAQAAQVDAALAAGKPAGPLAGVPIAIKEHVAIKGFPVFLPTGPGPLSTRDDILVERLRAAGAIIVGHTKMPGMGRSPIDPDLENHPRNPWDTSRVPGSSSAGSAAAAAAAMVPMAIGSDGGGSTRLPGALTGVIGVHTARGRIPYVNYEHGRFMLTVSTAPLARDIRDAAIAMQVMAGPDGRDYITLDVPPPDYVSVLDKGVNGLRFAWTDDFGYGHQYALPQAPRVISTVAKAARTFEKLGATVTPTKEVWEDFWLPYVTTSSAYGDGPTAGARPSPEAFQAASEVRGRNHAKFRSLFADCDVLLSPTVPFTAMTVAEWDAAWTKDGERYPHKTFAPTYTVDTHMFNWLGWPALSIPAGFVDGLPVGLQLIAPPEKEALLYQAAAAFQKKAPRTERPSVA